MAIARVGKTVTLTAVNEAIDLSGTFARIVGMTLRGTGLTAAQNLVIRDSAAVASGQVLVDYAIEAATDNADLWGGRPPQFVRGLAVDNNTVAGTWVVTVFLE
jgi:hypothetical protein